MGAGDYAAKKGGKVVALTIPKPFGIRLSFAAGFVLDALPGWEHVMTLPKAAKAAILSDPVARKKLDEQAKSPGPMVGLADWSTKRIFDVVQPETNVRIGTQYFKDLISRFGGAHFALASYNAGEGRVARWKAQRPDASQDEFIEDIPFPET